MRSSRRLARAAWVRSTAPATLASTAPLPSSHASRFGTVYDADPNPLGGFSMIKRFLGLLATVSMTILLLATFAPAQSPEAGRVFERNCVTCHGNPAVEKAPDPSVLRQM